MRPLFRVQPKLKSFKIDFYFLIIGKYKFRITVIIMMFINEINFWKYCNV